MFIPTRGIKYTIKESTKEREKQETAKNIRKIRNRVIGNWFLGSDILVSLLQVVVDRSARGEALGFQAFKLSPVPR